MLLGVRGGWGLFGEPGEEICGYFVLTNFERAAVRIAASPAGIVPSGDAHVGIAGFRSSSFHHFGSPGVARAAPFHGALDQALTSVYRKKSTINEVTGQKDYELYFHMRNGSVIPIEVKRYGVLWGAEFLYHNHKMKKLRAILARHTEVHP